MTDTGHPHPAAADAPATLSRGAGEGYAAGTTVGDVLDGVVAALAAAGVEEPRRLARRIIVAAMTLSPAEVFAHPQRHVGDEERVRIEAIAQRVAAREPLSRVLGHREFWGLDFRLSPDTLDPRPETETIVEAVLARLPDRERPYSFLDLGTGSGCLILALLSEYPNARGIGVDVSPGAAATARRNAMRHGMLDRAHFITGDWAAALAGIFDVVVANPPYVASGELAALPREVRDHDPPRALDGGANGLDAYRAIARDLARLVAEDGIFAAEIGIGQAGAVAKIIAAAGLAVEPAVADLAGIARVIVARRPAEGSPPQRPPAITKKRVGMRRRPD